MQKKYLHVLPIAIAALGLFLHHPPAQAKQPCTINQAILNDTLAGTSQISTAELRAILKNKTATVFDARPYREYSISHIPGARSLAAKPGVEKAVYVSDAREVERIVNGNKNAPIVLYCNGMY